MGDMLHRIPLMDLQPYLLLVLYKYTNTRKNLKEERLIQHFSLRNLSMNIYLLKYMLMILYSVLLLSLFCKDFSNMIQNKFQMSIKGQI